MGLFRSLPFLQRLRVSAIRFEALGAVPAISDVRSGEKRHMVVTEKVNQLAEFQLPSK
jgi:hypothetical protein